MNQKQLKNRLQEIKDKLISIEHLSENRIRLTCDTQNSFELNKFLFKDIGARFCIATGIDAEKCFEIIYHYSYDQTGCVIDLKAIIKDREKPVIESITPVLPAFEWIEREIHELLGIDFKNHPNLKPLLLADDWPKGVYPLRKDFKK